jgi:hypothetical protein
MFLIFNHNMNKNTGSGRLGQGITKKLNLTTVRSVDGLPKGTVGLATNLRACRALRRPDPDFARIGGMMRRFFLTVALQGTMQVLTMQVLTIAVMARFVSGL